MTRKTEFIVYSSLLSIPINVLVALAGNMIASCSDDGDVRVYQNRDLVHRLVGHTNSVMCLVALRNNKLASGSCDKSVRVWDTGSGVCLMRFEGTDDVVLGLVGLDDGRFVSRYCWRDHIDLWDTATRACSPITGTLGNPIMSMARMDDMIVYGCHDGTARVRCIWHAMYLACDGSGRSIRGGETWLAF
jgi:WD40 repeat protein